MRSAPDDEARHLRPPAPDTSHWTEVRILRDYISWAGPLFAPGEVVRLPPTEAKVAIARCFARLADEPDPGPVVLAPQVVRFKKAWQSPEGGPCFGDGDRVLLDGESAAAALRSGVAVPDNGDDDGERINPGLLRARERRAAREARRRQTHDRS